MGQAAFLSAAAFAPAFSVIGMEQVVYGGYMLTVGQVGSGNSGPRRVRKKKGVDGGRTCVMGAPRCGPFSGNARALYLKHALIRHAGGFGAVLFAGGLCGWTGTVFVQGGGHVFHRERVGMVLSRRSEVRAPSCLCVCVCVCVCVCLSRFLDKHARHKRRCLTIQSPHASSPWT